MNRPPRFHRTVLQDHARLEPVLEDRLMPDDDLRRDAVIAGVAAGQLMESFALSRSALRPAGPSPRWPSGTANLLFAWRRPIDEGGAMAVGSNEPGIHAAVVRKREDRVRDPERPLGGKMTETGIPREAPAKGRATAPTWRLPSPSRDGSR